MTGVIVAVTVLVYVIEVLLPGPVQSLLGYAPITTLQPPFEPWRMLTALLVHSPIRLPGNLLGITHVLFNMYALVLVGRPLEGLLGPWRLLALYLISGLGGSVAVQYAALAGILSPDTLVIGASGAVFGLFGALLAAQRRLGGDASSILIVIGLNLVLGFVLPGVAWEAHLGGLVVGLLTGWLLIANRGPRRARRQAVGLSAIAVVLVLLAVAPYVLLNVVTVGG
jgi:membrane associated rhomboid family serine protease